MILTSERLAEIPILCRLGFHRFAEMEMGMAGGIYYACKKCHGVYATGFDGSKVLVAYRLSPEAQAATVPPTPAGDKA